jgi:hypothetical protein
LIRGKEEMAYHNPIYATYNLDTKTLSSAATLYTISGPKGKKGVVTGVSVGLTTATTVEPTIVSVGTAGDTDKYAALSVPVASIGTTHNNASILTGDDNLIPADSAVVVATDGGSTAGAGHVAVTIAWF